MTGQTSEKNSREKITLAAITGIASGVARGIISWLLEHLR